MKFSFAILEKTRAVELHLRLFGTPIGARVHSARGGERVFLHQGYFTEEVHLHAPGELPDGSVFIARLTLTDSTTGETLQQHERLAAYDTVPPMVSSYRAILLRDGRVAIQVHAGDRHSEIPEQGLVTLFSTNNGQNWDEQVHGPVGDELGRPSVFEAVIGPFSPGTRLTLGIRASDNAGNSTERMPVDAAVLLAPINAERALGLSASPQINGSPLFAPMTVARLTPLLYLQLPPMSAVSTGRFEKRRLQELQELPIAFRESGIDLSGFQPVALRYVTGAPSQNVNRTVLELSAWR